MNKCSNIKIILKGHQLLVLLKLKATRYNIDLKGKWQYKDVNNKYVDMNITTDNIVITPTSGLLETQNVSTFRYIAENYYDEITILKISDGSNGLPGSDGTDGIYILVTNESHAVFLVVRDNIVK